MIMALSLGRMERTAERKNDPKNKSRRRRRALRVQSCGRYARRVNADMQAAAPITEKKLPKWLLWSLVTIVLWGAWGLVSKVASADMDAYTNQLLYTAG